LNFTRAAQRLRISQPALSKQITEIEEQLRFQSVSLATIDGCVDLTDAGRIFVEEARSALSHMERAVHLARTAHDGGDNVLLIGHSPDADQAWVSALLAIRLPLYPKLRIRLISQFSIELVRSVMAGELNLALVTAPPEDPQITAVPFALTPLYAALPQTHAAAQKEHIVLQDLAKDEWILLARRVHPVVHGAIMDAARREGIAPKHAHDIITAQQAVHLVSEHVGVAILTKPTALGFGAEGVVVKPLSDTSLCFETCVIMRNRRRFTIGKRVRPIFPPQICAPALATKANGIVAVRLSCQLGNGNPRPLSLFQEEVLFHRFRFPCSAFRWSFPEHPVDLPHGRLRPLN
jgi:DNA-binding transcriptional LysR family regulator